MTNLPRLAWRVENATAKNEADVYLYDVIGDPWEGTTASDFVQEVNDLDVDRINLHVNSPGGYVHDAIAMYNCLQGHAAEVVAYIEGSADSAASFVIQAADKRVIAKNASMTIHEGHKLAMGPASLFRQVADELDADSENIASIYAERAGGTADDWRQRMLANGGTLGTTYRGQGAVDIGLADAVGIATKSQTRVAAQVDPPPSDKVIDFGAALRGVRLESRAPTIQQLLEQHQKEPLSAAFGKGA